MQKKKKEISSSPSHEPSFSPSFPYFFKNTVSFQCRRFHWLEEFTFTSQDKHVLHFLNVFNTPTFIKHKPTNRKIFTFSTRSMYKNDWVKLVISKTIKLMYPKSQKILSFFSFFFKVFYNRSISKSSDSW